ncbi:DUF368 domain-containing protein [Halosegnis sp.]|uniref:DUF368 domain-containing protein n=1 Tax=Halosegnis sp. TaxID=2864959 RepID=UPI0035D525C1
MGADNRPDGGGRHPAAVIYLKGVCMGAADAVPGVSGGTIALIVGVYERLVSALTALDPRVLRHVSRLHTQDGRRALVRDLAAMDVPFLVALGLGVVTAVVAMSGVMHVAVTEYPGLTYAFFFGLIAASAVVLREELWLAAPQGVAAAGAGFTLAFLLSGVARNGLLAPSLPVLFVSGMIAVSAMILPGVSGSFILVLLGQYEFLTGAPGAFLSALVATLRGGSADLASATAVVVVFVAGAVVGLLTISHAVSYALATHRRLTLTFLVALVVGALRAPAIEVADAVARTPAALAAVTVAALVGAGLVLALDRTTDDLDY